MQATFIKSLICSAIAAVSLSAQAAPVLSTGGVTTVARTLAFSGLNTSNLDLSAYQESGVFATVNDVTYVGFTGFTGYDGRSTGFHYGSGGNESYVRIRGADDAVFTGIDFLLGNGWGMSSTTLRFETFLNGVNTGAAFANVANGVYKITDLGGFDEIRLGGNISGNYTAFGQFQAVAFDDMHLQLQATDVPEPAGLALFGLALAGLAAARRKKAA